MKRNIFVQWSFVTVRKLMKKNHKIFFFFLLTTFFFCSAKFRQIKLSNSSHLPKKYCNKNWETFLLLEAKNYTGDTDKSFYNTNSLTDRQQNSNIYSVPFSLLAYTFFYRFCTLNIVFTDCCHRQWFSALVEEFTNNLFPSPHSSKKKKRKMK